MPQAKSRSLRQCAYRKNDPRSGVPGGMTERSYFGDEVRGFGLRIRAAGSSSWIVQYASTRQNAQGEARRAARRHVGAARDAARKIMGAVRLAPIPPAKRPRPAHRRPAHVGALLPAFIARQRQRLKRRA